MTPCVHGDVVLAHVLDLEEGRKGNGTRTDDKECGLERILVKEVQEVGSVERGTIVIRKTPRVLCGAVRDIGVANASTTRPPTTGGVRGGGSVVWASSSCSGRNIWDLDTGCLNLGNPLLNLRSIGGRNDVKLGIIGRDDRHD